MLPFPFLLVGGFTPTPETAPQPFGYANGCECARSVADIDGVNAPTSYPHLDLTTYGIGCAAHDAATPSCAALGAAPECTAGVVPVPENCNRDPADPLPGWCQQQWCYLKDATACERTSPMRLAQISWPRTQRPRTKTLYRR